MNEITLGLGNQEAAAEEARRLDKERDAQARLDDVRKHFEEKLMRVAHEDEVARDALVAHAHTALRRVEQGYDDASFAAWCEQVERDITEQRRLDDDFANRRIRFEKSIREMERAAAAARVAVNDRHRVREGNDHRLQEHTQDVAESQRHASEKFSSVPATFAQARQQSAAAASQAELREERSRAFLQRQEDRARRLEATHDPDQRRVLELARDLERARYLANQKDRLAADPAAVGRDNVLRFQREATQHRIEIVDLTRQIAEAHEKRMTNERQMEVQSDTASQSPTNAAHQRLQAQREIAAQAHEGQQPPEITVVRASEHQARGIKLKALQAAERAREQAAQKEQELQR